MATLKYRNSDGTYIAIPALQGPKGDKGDKGDKGNTGPAGGILDVYASSTKGYITVKNADGSTKNVPVGDPNALLTTGGTMSDQAWITWPDTGNWGNSNEGVTFPVTHGGLYWIG